MFHYFFGPDTYGARAAIEALRKAAKSDIKWVSEEDFKSRSVSGFLEQSRGLLGSSLIVIMDPSELGADIQEQVMERHEDKQEWPAVAWDRGAPDRRGRLFKALGKGGREFKRLDPARAQAWIIEEAKSQGGSISRPAAQVLVNYLGTDRWRLRAELMRLLLVADDITPELVQRELVSNQAMDIFPALDALIKNRKDLALKHIEKVLAQGANEQYVLSMLAYQFRLLMQVKAGIEAGMSAAEMARGLKAKPFPIEKTMPVARLMPREKILRAQTKIMAADFAIKNGKIEARTALLMLVPNLLA